MGKIEVVGINNLIDEEKEMANAVLNEYLPKIERLVKNEVTIKISIKEHNKESKKKKYSLHVEIIFSGRVMNAESWDYDFSKALHKVMKKIETEVEHKFHSSEQNR